MYLRIENVNILNKIIKIFGLGIKNLIMKMGFQKVDSFTQKE